MNTSNSKHHYKKSEGNITGVPMKNANHQMVMLR